MARTSHSVPQRMMRCSHCDFINTDLDGECPTCGRFLRPHYLGKAVIQEHDPLIGSGQSHYDRHSDSRPPRFIALHLSLFGGCVSQDHQDPFATAPGQPSPTKDKGKAPTATSITPPTNSAALRLMPSSVLRSLPPPLNPSFKLPPKKSGPIVIRNARGEIVNFSRPSSSSVHATLSPIKAATPPEVKPAGQSASTTAPSHSLKKSASTKTILGFSSRSACCHFHRVWGLASDEKCPDGELEYNSGEADTEDENVDKEDKWQPEEEEEEEEAGEHQEAGGISSVSSS
jgi:hypothetical protein